jgi:hypothetical protein
MTAFFMMRRDSSIYCDIKGFVDTNNVLPTCKSTLYMFGNFFPMVFFLKSVT